MITYACAMMNMLTSHHETLMFDFAGSRPDDKKSEGALFLRFSGRLEWTGRFQVLAKD